MAPSGIRMQPCFLFFCFCILMGSAYVASQGCHTACHSDNDCQGSLICSSGTCWDDPDVGSTLCGSSGDGSNNSTGGSDQGCGAACQNDDDCSGQLICGDDNTCAADPNLETSQCDTSGNGSGGCGDQCQTADDCQGQLFCGADNTCADDPSVGTNQCGGNPNSNQGNDPNNNGQSGNSTNNPGGSGTGSCSPQSFLSGTGHSCDQSNNAVCCESGTQYPQFDCSPQVSSKTAATLTLNSFQDGGDGGGASACDGQFHDDSENVVALSTGWFSNGDRCNKQITIFANGQSVQATVVDECDSQHGCDEEHAFQPPCSFDVVDASMGVWQQLGVSSDDPRFGFMEITWTDA